MTFKHFYLLNVLNAYKYTLIKTRLTSGNGVFAQMPI